MIEESEAMKKLRERNLLAEFRNKIATIPSTQDKVKELREKQRQEEHDRIIAYTSQLAHVVSNAYVKSPNSRVHKGFSAGSYKDLTRVARLNPRMWTELFMENKENLVNEIDGIIAELQKYSDAIKNNDEKELEKLLSEGSKIKAEVG